MDSPHDHPLFQRYPLDGQVKLSTGIAPTPYHVYDGHGLFIGGTADLAAARELLAPEQVQAVQTAGGRALMGVWVFDFAQASLGSHHEAQISLFVSHGILSPVSDHPLGLIELMLNRPDVHMLCHGLWNNTPEVVAYNRELLGLDARTSASRIERHAAACSFRIDDGATGVPVLEGRFDLAHRPSWRANLALLTQVGLRRLMQAAREPWLRMHVLNPIGERFAHNARAESFTKVARSAIRFFDPRGDHLAIHHPRYRALDFKPRFSQGMDGFRFVYMTPR